jgi:hypothetical protein
MGPPAPDDTGPPPAHRPPSVVTTSRSSPWSASTPATRPARTCGDLGAPAPPLLPHQPTGTWPWTSSPGRPGGERGAAAWRPAKQRQVWRRPSCEPRMANVRPSFARQARFGSDDQAAHRPQRPVEPGAPTVAGPAAPMYSGSSAVAAAADTGRVSVRTPGSHRSCGHQARGHRMHGHRTRGHRTSTRPVGRTSVRMADSGRGQSDERRGRRPDILDGTTTATAGWAAKARSGCRVGGARQPYNAAAVAGQLRSATRHEAAPGALLSCVGFGGYEERATGLRKGEVCGVRLV